MKTMHVMIDGVRYVPDPTIADEVSFWWMNDDHTFVHLHGANLDEIIDAAEKARRKYDCSGLLCPAMLLRDGKDVRSVGPCAHSNGRADDQRWRDQLSAWRKSVEADSETMILITAG